MLNKNLYFLIFLLFFIDLFAVGLFLIFNIYKDEELELVLRINVRLAGLTDTALVTEARYIRHRSIADLYSVFDYSPESREVFPFSFVYYPSENYNAEKVFINEIKQGN